ncbi:MAG: translocation/assembly module TamB domain-containing protein [Bacteroidales bacterium]|nr:translocation/assembly module TamB domain-containing protein [Bacteroidales bacterium]
MAISTVVTLFVAIQDPIIQRFAVRFAGGYLSEKTGADIKVGRIAVTPDFRVFVRDVFVKDLNGNNLAQIGSFRTKFHITDLLEGKIHLGDVVLGDADINLIKYEGAEAFNFQFLADFFSSGEKKEKDPNKKPMPIEIDHISLKNVFFKMLNENRADSTKTANHRIDYSHLDLDGINLEAKHFTMVGDSIFVVVEKLQATEQCGLDLKHFQSDVTVCQKGIFLKDMQMETNNSLFHLDLNMNYDGYSAFKHFVDSVEFDAKFHPTDVMLSDIGYFASVMNKMPNQLNFQGRFSGPIEHFSVDDMNVRFGKETQIKGSLKMHPLDFMDGEHELNIKNMHFTYDDLTSFHIPSKTVTIPLPEQMNTLKSGDIKLNFKGSYNDFVSNVSLVSDIGNVEANVSRDRHADGSNVFYGNINSEGIDAGMIANASNIVGKLDMNAEFTATFPKEGNPDFVLNGNIHDADLLGNHIDIVELNGDMKENRFDGKLRVIDNELDLDFNGLIDFSDPKKPKSDFVADIRHADLRSLNLMKKDSVSVVSTKIYANMTGFDIDNLEGTLHLDSTVYHDSRGTYTMKSFDASIVNDNLMQRRININNDFFDFEMGGKVNFAHLLSSLDEYGDTFVHFPIWADRVEAFKEYKLKHDVEQDFFFHLNLKDTETLSRLFMPNLQIAKNTTVNGTFTSRTNALNMTARSKAVLFGDVAINNIELRNFNTPRSAFGTLSIGEVKWQRDTVAYGLENLSLSARMADDTITTRIRWDDISLNDHNKALIETKFHPHEHGGTFVIDTAGIIINDTLWTVAHDNYIDLDGQRVEISNVLFSHDDQFLKLDGYAPLTADDTLTVEMHRFDVSMFDILTQGKGFDADGFITGRAKVGGLNGNPMVLADLNVEGLGVNGDKVGDAAVHSHWDNAQQAINVDMSILTDHKQTLNVLGAYYVKRETDNLDFNVKMDSLQLGLANPFVSNLITRVQGYGNGNLSVTGSLKEPKLSGRLDIKDGGCKVNYLNTFFTFSPTILIDSKVIEFQNMVLTDTLGNKAPVQGKIHHNNLKDFYMDLKLHPRNFLVMATTLKDNDTFYGSVIADGLASVKGPVNDILLDIKAMTRKGTKLTLPLNRVSSVSENDFIVFINNAEEEEEVIEEEKKRSNFALNLDVDVTDVASMKINLPGEIGTIDATGNGNLKMGTSSAEKLTLFGDYSINSGRFQLNFKNILNKTFNLEKGGTINWTGSPTDGRINATGVYSTKASVATLGVQVDSTSSVSNIVNVECLIHLKDALLNPTITFGMRLPNASDDIHQTVFALIDTTNQAAMSSQVISLLMFGTFAYAGTTNDAPDSQYLSGFISGLLPSLTLDLGSGVDLDFHYHTGDAYSYDEMQIALRTELFEDRLMIETNLGVISDNTTNAGNASNLVGEFDIKYKLSQDGRLVGYFYNHSNYNSNFSNLSFDRLAPYTQGLGISYGRSFDSFGDIFKPKKKQNASKPFINNRGINGTLKP